MTITNLKQNHDRHNLSAFLDGALDYHSDFNFLHYFIQNKNEISLSNIDLEKRILNPEVIVKYYLMCSVKNQTSCFWSVFWKYILTVKDPPIVCYPHPVEKKFMDIIHYFEDLLDALSCPKKESLGQLGEFIGNVFDEDNWELKYTLAKTHLAKEQNKKRQIEKKEQEILKFFLYSNAVILSFAFLCLLIALVPNIPIAASLLTTIIVISMTFVYFGGVSRFLLNVFPILRQKMTGEAEDHFEQSKKATNWWLISVIVTYAVVLSVFFIAIFIPPSIPFIVVTNFIVLSGFLAFSALCPLLGTNGYEKNLDDTDKTITFRVGWAESLVYTIAITVLTVNMFFPIPMVVLLFASMILMVNACLKLHDLHMKINESPKSIDPIHMPEKSNSFDSNNNTLEPNNEIDVQYQTLHSRSSDTEISDDDKSSLLSTYK
tara:strand:+ start:1160 stop:2455 length:1296 start_codon:yes stop_codon:yes gene_type:complete